jgi:hypothetical protein
VRRPPPGVGVVRRALQHSRPGSRRGEAARSPLLLFLHRVAARARLCRYVLGGAPRAANVVKARPCGGGGVGPRRSGPGAQKRRGGWVGGGDRHGEIGRERRGGFPFVRLPPAAPSWRWFASRVGGSPRRALPVSVDGTAREAGGAAGLVALGGGLRACRGAPGLGEVGCFAARRT